MGQLLMKMYPELSCVQSDVLGTGKHFNYSSTRYTVMTEQDVSQWHLTKHVLIFTFRNPSRSCFINNLDVHPCERV